MTLKFDNELLTTVGISVAHGVYYTSERTLNMGIYVCVECGTFNSVDDSFCSKCRAAKFILKKSKEEVDMITFNSAQTVLYQKLVKQFADVKCGTRNEMYQAAKKLSSHLFTHEQLSDIVNAAADNIGWSEEVIRK